MHVIFIKTNKYLISNQLNKCSKLNNIIFILYKTSPYN